MGGTMQQKCSICHTAYDLDDAFCRKCGTSLGFDTTIIDSNEETTGDQAISHSDREVKTGEIITVAQASRELDKGGTRTALFNLSKKVSSKVTEALKTEQGRKLAQGATALAVAVGVELVNHAAGKLAKGKETGQSGQTNNRQLARQPTSMADAFLKAFEDQLAHTNQPSDKPAVEETIIKERIYIKRVWRKPQD